mmetsp:Transcript_7121/g.16668  ORF Transcript_7121/g.16668 Transcript_7121/m.16668 type:complete len:410 (+) Transcript_7121:854-2083(+)
MFLMSMFDFTTAMGWVIGAAPIPTTDMNGYDSNVVGASGNDDLCTAQGFFVMLGYGSLYFNNSLSIYYVLVVVCGWKDYQLRKVRPYLLTVPIVCAMILAFGGIPFYESVWIGCWMLPRPYTDDWTAVGFSFGPVITTAIISTACQIRVYWRVRATVRKARRWSMDHRLSQRSEKDKYTYNAPSNSSSQFSMATTQEKKPQEEEGTKKNEFSCNCCKNSPLLQDNAEAAVFWQSVFYLFAMYVSWPILVVAIMNADSEDYGFWMALSILAPLQGWLNMLVFIRPRISKWYRSKKLEKEKKRKLLGNQQKAKVSQRTTMNVASGVTDKTASQFYRQGQDSASSFTFSIPEEVKPVPVEVAGGGMEVASHNETKTSNGSAVPEGSAWDLVMNEQTKDGDPGGYSKQFDCLA